MLDKNFFKKQMERLAVLYPNWKIDITDSDVMKIWYNEFKDYEDKIFKEKVQDYIDQESYPPTVAGIKNTDGPDDGVTVV